VGGVVDAVSDIIETVVDIVEGGFDIVEDIVKGTIVLAEGALEGDMDAILAIGVMAAGGYFAYAGYAGVATSQTSLWLSKLSVISWEYSTLSTLRNIGVLSQQDFTQARRHLEQMESSAMSASLALSFSSNKNKWLAGGDLYNEIYAGGDLFNITGSRNQHRMFGRPDANSDARLSRTLGNTHDYHRRTSAHKIGTENFSVFLFGSK